MTEAKNSVELLAVTVTDHDSSKELGYSSSDLSCGRSILKRNQSSDSSLSKIVQFSEHDDDEPDSPENKNIKRYMEKHNSFSLKVDFTKLVVNELELKAALYSHICNPVKRWKVDHIIPYKLIMEIAKTILVIIQVFLFAYTLANNRAMFLVRSKELFEHLLLKSEGRESSLYTQQQMIDELAYTINKYYQVPNVTLGGYGHQLDSEGNIEPIVATLRQYRQADIEPSTTSIVMDYTIDTTTIYLRSNDTFMQVIDEGLNWNEFIDLSLRIRLKNIRTVRDNIDCHVLTILIYYSNTDHSGIISYSLRLTDSQYINCNVEAHNQNKARKTTVAVFRTLIDVVVIIICFVSTIFAVTKYWRAYRLGKAMGEFYRMKLEIILSWKERRSLFSLWLLFTVASNMLLIIGSILKIDQDFNASDLESISVRILLGSAVLIEAVLILRYISLFKQLNALPRTLSYALPDLMKFLLCTLILFFSFSISGAIIFAPYNERFSDFPKSLQSLFVLTNGDDIYPMFRSFDDSQSTAINAYGQIFIYVFVVLFLYAVFNLFTSLIINAHENSKLVDRASINEVRRFVFSGPLTSSAEGKALRDIIYVTKYVDPAIILAKRKKRKKDLIGDLD